MQHTETGLYRPQPRHVVVQDLLDRSRRRLDKLSVVALLDILEDALYHERKRLRRAPPDEPHEARLNALARAIVRGGRAEQTQTGLALVAAWADEVHGNFNKRVYKFATRALPRALNGLLASRKGGLRDWTGSQNSRVQVEGNTELIRTLSREATLILAPTHVSNLDSPLIGLALYTAGLPPFVYGAGLNLFTNPVMGWWMHRLGAYTVDRLKQARLYKHVLKDYSVRCLTTRHHSLFFPGGTRARSGEVETNVKKGLLGTAGLAWQEMLAAGRTDSEVYIVPLTLSYQLVLEANTLIEDHLAEAGKQRYIISDDEFAQPRQVLAFGRRVLDLDASVTVHFGDPIDVLGNPVSADADERRSQAEHRKRYVCDANGNVEWDSQRDRVYTNRLAQGLSAAYPKYAHVMATHIAAYAAWQCLEDISGITDTFRMVRMPHERRQIPSHTYLEKLRALMDRVKTGASEKRWCSDLPTTAEAVLDLALDRFGRYHRSHAIRRVGTMITVEDPKLCLYYRNRLAFVES